MKVFISWSGDTSKAIAETLREWFPSVLQAVKPYFSPDDITKGSRWGSEIAKELEECKIGLLCLTADNLDAPWIMFETGALSKSISAARVCPLLFGIEPSDVKGPLVQFQAAPFARDEMKKTIRMMNQELGTAALTSEVLDSVFEMWWPKLEERIRGIMEAVHATSKQSLRSERDILEEILARVRAAPPVLPQMDLAIDALEEMFNIHRMMMDEVSHLPPEIRGQLAELADRLRMPIEYMSQRMRHVGRISLHERHGRELLRRRVVHEKEIQSPSQIEEVERTGDPTKPPQRIR